MIKGDLWFIFGIGMLVSINILNGEPINDSLKTKSPSEAAMYGLFFPGGGQIYNEKYLKAGIIMGFEIYSLIKFNEYRLDVKCDNVTSAISKRNKSAWWVFFLYFYGILDAVVDAHLMGQKTVMETPIVKVN